MKFNGVLGRSKNALVVKVITSIFLQGTLLVVPIFWSKSITYISNALYKKAVIMVVLTLILSLLYYLWYYINQKSWYDLYSKITINFMDNITSVKDKNISLGEYTNIINNDIDIVATFICNGVTRIIQILEFLVIYIYFLNLNIYIFWATLGVSVIIIYIIFMFGDKLQLYNKRRKESLDRKTINIHGLFEIITNRVSAKRDNSLMDSTNVYLYDNAKYNVFAYGMICFVLGLVELFRYVIIIYAIYLVSIGNMEIGGLLLIYSYYAKMLTNFEMLATISADYHSVKVSLDRINKIKV